MHFITWASAYGGVGGSGPSSTRTAEFDDVVLSMMALSGWTSVLYYARGFQARRCMHAEGGANAHQWRHSMSCGANGMYRLMQLHVLPKPVGTL